MPEQNPATARPIGMSLGLGINYALGGAEFDRPDGASARLRLDSGLTLEPFLRLATHGQSTMNGDFKNAQNELMLGSNVRIPYKSRGKVDLVIHGGAGIGIFSNDPDGDDNNNSITRFALDYGLSLEYWYSANWCMSLTARNPFLTYESRDFEISGDATETDTDIGIIWDPTVDLGIHLFF